MAAVDSEVRRDPGNEPGSRISSVPLLSEGFSESTSTTPKASERVGTLDDSTQGGGEETPEAAGKSSKRRFWGLGRKKEEDKSKRKSATETTTGGSVGVSPITTGRPTSPLLPSQGVNPSSSPHRVNHPYGAPSSPNRHLYSTSPRVSSPASSQIFERDVQEDGLVTQASPAIPSHITTENHIPPVLEASSLAITDNHLDPDSVEIVMHSAHQPAAVTVAGAGIGEFGAASWHEDAGAHPDNEDSASNYGALDSADVRRLSFISFADVVHSEHAEHGASKDSLHLAGLTSAVSPLAPANRSPSPVRSPVSSHGHGGSPPNSGAASIQGLDSSPHRNGRGPTSPFSAHSPPSGGELTIETMRQALRKTGSGDLGGHYSQPMSAVGGDEASADHRLSRAL